MIDTTNLGDITTSRPSTHSVSPYPEAMRALRILIASAVLISPLGAALATAEPASAATCPTPPGTIDRPVVQGSYVTGLRVPLLTWTTTCPNLTDFRLVWSFIRADGTFTDPMAWEGRATSFQIPEPEDPNAVAVSFGLQNRDLLGGTGFTSAQIPLQIIAPTSPGTPKLTDNGEGRVTVAWTPPRSDGGASPTYTVRTSPATEGCTTTETSCLITGLRVDSTYDVTVEARTSAGTGPASAVARITPAGPRLLAPTRVSAKATGSTIRVTWRPPSGEATSTPVRYVVASKPSGLACRTDATTCIFRRLEPGTSASFTVTGVRGAKRTASAPSPTVRIPLPPPTPAIPTTPAAPPKPLQELS